MGNEYAEYLLRLFAAVVAGAVIGFERELNDKPAGFRTNILICFGAALFTVMSIAMATQLTSDRARIAAQIVSGVGFLGAGAIVHFKGNVLGLTTAATIWAVASIGMAFGAGEYLVGTFGTALTAAVLFGLAYAEEWISTWRVTTRFKIKLRGALEAAEIVKQLAAERRLRIRTWMVTKLEEGEEGVTVRLSVMGPHRQIEQFQAALAHCVQVASVRRV